MPAKPRFTRQTASVRRDSLIDAALRCLARGGLASFTIDNISKEAQVSRGLINHHFDGIEDLMLAVYVSMTSTMEESRRAALLVDGGPEQRLLAVVDTMFAPPMFSKASLRAWLALWGEVAVNPKLRAAHRSSYGHYRRAMAAALADVAAERKLKLDTGTLATTIIALIDGLWIEWCLDSSAVSRQTARDMVQGVLEARLGPVQR